VHVDAFIAANQPDWDRLAELTARGGRRGRGLRAAELDELVRLYQRTSTHLSLARSRYHDASLTAALTTVVARAGSVVYGTRPRTLRGAVRFVTDTFPAAVWHDRWFLLAATLLFCIPATVIALWLGSSPAALDAAAPEALREAYVTEDFADYYTNLASAEFAATVTTNNIQVGILAFASGILLGIPTVIVLVLNGANVGFAWGLFIAAGEQPRFWGLIAPHGLLELTAVFVAGAVGLRLGWTLIDPGDRRRGEALVAEGRRAIAVVIGLVGVFSIAGLIEGFVTGAPWPTWVRVGIGMLAEAAFLALVWVRGRAAARRGLVGALGEQSDAGWARAA
jgi:uncharacterized membrane protein SpoIIM required for sporulation